MWPLLHTLATCGPCLLSLSGSSGLLRALETSISGTSAISKGLICLCWKRFRTFIWAGQTFTLSRPLRPVCLRRDSLQDVSPWLQTLFMVSRFGHTQIFPLHGPNFPSDLPPPLSCCVSNAFPRVTFWEENWLQSLCPVLRQVSQVKDKLQRQMAWFLESFSYQPLSAEAFLLPQGGGVRDGLWDFIEWR